MSIGPVTINGVIQRATDVGTVKHQEDSKPLVDQQNIQSQIKNDKLRQMQQVRHADDSDNHQKKYDAKEKGSNEYQGQKGKKRKHEEKKDEGVVLKSENSHFDMKI